MSDSVFAQFDNATGYYAARVASQARDGESEVSDPIQIAAVREMWKRGLRDVRIGIPSNYGRDNGVAGFVGAEVKMLVEIRVALPWEGEVR